MSRNIKIFGFVGFAVLIVVLWVSPGAGTYIALKANFTYGLQYQILNAPEMELGIGGYPYVDSGKAQGNPWIWFDSGNGRFRMTVARNSNTSRPYVQVKLNEPPLEAPAGYQPPSLCYVYAGKPNVPNNIKWFWFTSGGELRDYDHDGVMEPGEPGFPAYPTLSFKDMNAGETKFCSLACRFQTFDNQCEYDWGGAPSPELADNVVKVTVNSVDGKKVWVITPYVGKDQNGNVVQDCSKRKLWRAIYTKKSGAGYGGYCDAGVWDADFELWITQK